MDTAILHLLYQPLIDELLVDLARSRSVNLNLQMIANLVTKCETQLFPLHTRPVNCNQVFGNLNLYGNCANVNASDTILRRQEIGNQFCNQLNELKHFASEEEISVNKLIKTCKEIEHFDLPECFLSSDVKNEAIKLQKFAFDLKNRMENVLLNIYCSC